MCFITSVFIKFQPYILSWFSDYVQALWQARPRHRRVKTSGERGKDLFCKNTTYADFAVPLENILQQIVAKLMPAVSIWFLPQYIGARHL